MMKVKNQSSATWKFFGGIVVFCSYLVVLMRCFFMNVVPFNLQIRGPIYLAVFGFSHKIHVSKIIPVLRSSCNFLYSFTLLGNMSCTNCINQVRQARRKIRRQRMREEWWPPESWMAREMELPCESNLQIEKCCNSWKKLPSFFWTWERTKVSWPKDWLDVTQCSFFFLLSWPGARLFSKMATE